MKIYLPRNLLADSKQIGAWQKERQAIQDGLTRARKSLAHLEMERGRILQRLTSTKMTAEGMTLPRPEPKAVPTDPNLRRFQQEQIETDYQARLEAARKPYLDQLKFLESELAEWERQHGQELNSLREDIATLEKRFHELDAKLKDFVCIEGDDLL